MEHIYYSKTSIKYMNYIERLKSLDIQSATTIAIESLEYLRGFAIKRGFGEAFDEECTKLLDARPTAVVLHNAIEHIKEKPAGSVLEKVIRDLQSARDRAAKNASEIFITKTDVLTHCHSTFVVAALVKNRGSVRNVIVTETRPKDQGVRTAKDLLAAKIPVTFIIDSAVSDLISQTDIVVVGADALRKEGLVNKVGTHPLACVAKENNKPFYVITSSFTLDRRKKITMEQRPASELHHPDLRGAKILNPSFDITPWRYVSAVVTEKGIITPGKLKW